MTVWWQTNNSERRQSANSCGGLLRGTIVVMFAVIGVAAPAQSPLSVDANLLVHQMIAKYQSAQTVTETSETRIWSNGGPETIQTSRLQYKRPNLLMLETQDPDLGTLKSCSDGSIVTVYSGRQNFYTRLFAPPNLSFAASTISKASDRLTGTPLNQVLSPLSFLAARGMPIEAKTFQYVGMRTVERRKTYCVKGIADLTWLHSMIPFSADVIFDRRDIFMWIDTASKALVRSGADLAWHKAVGNKIQSSKIKFQETHHNITFNSLLRDEIFKLALPKGASEVFP